MAKLFGKTLLSLVAACVAHGVTLAQDLDQSFREAVRMYRTDRSAEGLEKLKELVGSGPTQEQAFELVKATDAAVWQLLLSQGGDTEQIARHLMGLATVARKQMSRDDAAIRGLIGGATSDESVERRKAVAQLAAEHGEFAVPALLEILGDADQSKAADRAMLTIFNIGRPAVMPLVAALKSDNALLRRNCAAALVEIADRRAAAPLAWLAATDTNEAIRDVAERGLARLGVTRGTSAVELFQKDAEAYLSGVGVREGDRSEVVWTWKDGKLAHADVPASLYSFELAKAWAHDAVRLDPANEANKSLLARSYLAQVAAIKQSAAANPDDTVMQELANAEGRLKLVAAAMGEDVIARAVADSIAQSQSAVAIEAIEALGGTQGAAGNAALVAALDDVDANVRYAAALALSQGNAGSEIPSAAKVVGVLAQAVAEEAIRSVLVVDANPVTQKVAREASARRGISVAEASSGKGAIADFYSFPRYDVVVVSDTLRDILPEDVISLIRSRAPATKVLLLTQSDESAARFEGKVDGVIKVEGSLAADALVAQANEVAGEIDARRAGANKVAIAAAHSIVKLAREKVNVMAAADSLAAQLDRDDAVAIPAATALGEGGTLEHVAKLAALVTGEAGSEGLRVAAAEAVGGILARSNAVPDAVFDGLLAIARNEEAPLALRSAIVSSLGRGKLAPGARSQLAAALAMVAQAGGGEG
jgi:CheY-like chemotaxis protein